MKVNHQLEAKILERRWFYRFELPSGRITDSYLAEFAQPVHTTRDQMMRTFVENEFGQGLDKLRCIDLACMKVFFRTSSRAWDSRK